MLKDFREWIKGKGKEFTPPVLVVHKLNKTNFIGMPLTSQFHTGTWYVEFEFRNKKEYAVVAQVENISVYRLHHRYGEASESDSNKVIDGLCGLLLKINSLYFAIRAGEYPQNYACIIANFLRKIEDKKW